MRPVRRASLLVKEIVNQPEDHNPFKQNVVVILSVKEIIGGPLDGFDKGKGKLGCPT
ncbi:hypothetical protein FRB93_012481 [Tulasnella sp. JGI-2019a]|nr:hypothetical protein FRB93_012481 [Tulasnella sp. JGI-2019a]